jgi:hypothetical protein
MGAISNHHDDVAQWIKLIIKSCETHEQLETAARLADLFISKLKYDMNRSLTGEIKTELERATFKKSLYLDR